MTDKEKMIDQALNRAAYIIMLSEAFAEKNPVMLLELPSEKIFAYPYLDFKNPLSARSQELLEQQYRDALENKQIVVFVKDNNKQKMISILLDSEG